MGALTFTPPATDLADDLSRYLHREKGVTLFEIAVKGARCANCIAKIEGSVRAIPGISQARLNLSTAKLAAEWHGDDVSPHSVIARVRSLGYEARPYDAGESEADTVQEGRGLLRCLAAAGFGSAFVVGLTDAVWYGGGDMAGATRDTFFWLAACVSLPLTLYAAQPFFRSAKKTLAKGRTNMDVPISLAILLSLALSLYQTLTHGLQVYFDAAIMLTFLLLVGRYLDYRMRDRARGAAGDLIAMQWVTARRLRSDDLMETVAARDLAPGDRILLASGERAPVDGIVLDCDTEADISLVTGESLPVPVARGTLLRAGSVVLGRPIVLKVAARVENSLVADLARLLEAGQQARGVYVRLADRAARLYVPFVLGLALLIFSGWWLTGAPLSVAVTNAITVLIITCPCALGLAVPTVQIVATGRLFKRGILVKSGDALERLAEIDIAIFDKTGTLTTGTPSLLNREAVAASILEQAARLARASRHPLAMALACAAGEGPVQIGAREVTGNGIEAEIDGVECRLGRAAWCGANDAGPASSLWFRMGDAPPTRFAFKDGLRPDARAMLHALNARGIETEMLTGDLAAPSADVAIEAGLEIWSSEANPQIKATRMEELRRAGRKVLMVGDGLNDAGALALAHVSIAPGSAADASQLAADMILRGDRLMPIIEAIDVSRKARRLVLENFALAAAYNIGAIPLAAMGLVSPLIAAASMAASSLFVTLNALRLVRL